MNTENARLLKTRRALFGCFLVLGFVMASWIVRTPSIRDALSASTAEMGLILFGFSLGSMGGILLAGNIVARIGADRAVCAGMTLALAGLIVLSSGTHLALAWMTGFGLGLVGFGMAQAEVAVNVLGAHVERGLGRPVLTLVHGCFSLGTTLGAVCGLLLVAKSLPVTSHMLVVCEPLSPMLVYLSCGRLTRHRCDSLREQARLHWGAHRGLRLSMLLALALLALPELMASPSRDISHKLSARFERYLDCGSCGKCNC
ncbi:hypothetical protein R6G53_000765 [Citrobacter freundii]|nr:hypothetical protein [Citrobacter freundii]